MNSGKYNFSPIGFAHCQEVFPEEAPRQGVFAHNLGYVKLNKNCNFEQALEDLEGFERIWLIFLFHHNNNWKPKVRPPYGGDKKYGVFSTRAPYRPNPIGISAVELIKVENLTLYIRNFDLLDNTPILDIKPYIPEADAFPNSIMGWRSKVKKPLTYFISSLAQKQIEKLLTLGGPNLGEIGRIQLSCHDINPKTQRVKISEDGVGVLAYRTWRIHFKLSDKSVTLLSIASGYTKEELCESSDPYSDKELHRKFL